jgi:hypothetical protein
MQSLMVLMVNHIVYYNNNYIFCQEMIKKMDIPDNLTVLKEAIIELINQCQDANVLDLIFQIIPLL